MNSMSRPHCNDDSHKEIDCCRKHKETEVLLKCGNPGSLTLPIVTVAGTQFTLTTLNLNTNRFCNPCIKFEFASDISTIAGININLSFQIFKQCRNQFAPVPVGPAWIFTRAASLVEANTFSFFVCDCDICPEDCCTYSVIVTSNAIGTVAAATITNATLSALIVENNCGCC